MRTEGSNDVYNCMKVKHTKTSLSFNIGPLDVFERRRSVLLKIQKAMMNRRSCALGRRLIPGGWKPTQINRLPTTIKKLEAAVQKRFFL